MKYKLHQDRLILKKNHQLLITHNKKIYKLNDKQTDKNYNMFTTALSTCHSYLRV